jgi:hypothetical protein
MMGHGEPFANVGQNQIRFITFNYDRSLELYLHQTIRNHHLKTDKESYAQWSKVGLMHMYGQVGPFDFSNRGLEGRPYTSELSTRAIEIAAAGIHIMTNDRTDENNVSRSQAWFEWADQVYILGFSFDPMNCERLGFK